MLAAVGGTDGGDLDARLVGRVRDGETGVLGWPSVLAATRQVRRAVADLVAAERVPLLLGGCCTLLPGALAGALDALADGTAGEAAALGLAYLDGHLDLYDGRTSPTGEGADMPMAVVSGHGPAAWVREVGAPLVRPGRLALLGIRDRDEAESLGSVLPEDLGLDPERSPLTLRGRGLAVSGADVHRQLAASGAGYWVHLDVDVLDEDVFPATDYLMPGGLSLPELTDLFSPLAAGPGLVGLSIGCYNPEKDPDGAGAGQLVTLLGAALGAAPG